MEEKLREFYDIFSEIKNTSKLCNFLYSETCLTPDDKEIVETRLKNYSPREANFELYKIICRKFLIEEDLEILLTALQYSGNNKLASLLKNEPLAFNGKTAESDTRPEDYSKKSCQDGNTYNFTNCNQINVIIGDGGSIIHTKSMDSEQETTACEPIYTLEETDEI